MRLQNSSNSLLRKIFFSFLFVLFLNIFFFHSGGSVAFVLKAVGFFLLLLAVLTNKDTYKKPYAVALFALLLAATSYSLLITANSFVNFIVTTFLIGSFLTFIYILATRIPFIRSLMELLCAGGLLGLSYLKNAFLLLVSFGKKGNRSGSLLTHRPKYVSYVLGAVLGIPVFLILILLFSNADPIYASFVHKILSVEFLRTLVQRLILSTIIFLALIPLVTLQRGKEFRSPLSILNRFSFVREMTIIMCFVAVALASFIIIQWPYVFAKVALETDLSKYGVATYSEYVRKGFIELLQAAFLIYLLVWAGLVILRNSAGTIESLWRRNSNKGARVLASIQLLVIAEFFVFLISVFRRVWLYQQYHGWSLIRIYGSIFLLWILAIALVLVLRHFFTRRWVITEVLVTIIAFIVFALFNHELFIVNTHPPTVNNHVDYLYLARMSPDGVKGWMKAYDHAKSVIEKNEGKNFYDDTSRREIAYSGMILQKLTQNYDKLTRKYASEDDLKAYYNDVLVRQQEVNWNMLQRVQPISQTTIQPSQGITPTPALYYSLNGYQYTSLQGQDYSKKIQDLLLRIKNNKISGADLSEQIVANWYIPEVTFDQSDLTQQSFYQLSMGTTAYIYGHPYARIKTDPLDRFFSFNASSHNAYQELREYVPIKELLVLQKKYYDIYQKISNQNSKDRDYQKDISTETPFLESL